MLTVLTWNGIIYEHAQVGSITKMKNKQIDEQPAESHTAMLNFLFLISPTLF